MGTGDVDLNLLRVFDTVMNERSVTRTADILGRTQSAVSHSLLKLRQIFQDELFTRDKGEMKPTPRAIELAPDISEALASIRSTIARYQHFAPGETERNFRIGLSDYDTMIFIPGLLEQFKRTAPHATINIIRVSAPDVSKLIHTRQIDCAIVSQPLESDDANLQRVELGRDRLLCAIWSGSGLAQAPLTLDRYLAASHLQISSDGVAASLADTALKEMGLTRRVTATIPTYLLVPKVLRGSDFITHCGDSIQMILDDTSEVALRLPPLPALEVSMTLILHKQRSSDPGIAWLRKLISELFVDWQQRKRAALDRQQSRS